MTAVLLKKYVDSLIAPVTTAFGNAQARLQSEIDSISAGSGGPTGGTAGQVLISAGSSDPEWSTLLVVPQPTSFSGSLELSGSFNSSFSSIASISIVAEGNGDYNDINIVLEPVGNGSFVVGPAPDGTTAGGAPRGINSVDLQMVRAFPNQVVLGDNSVITGGTNNFNGGSLSFIGSGNNNEIVPGVGTSFLGGGENNSIVPEGPSTDHNVIVGGIGNTNGGQYSSIVGGQNNEIFKTYSVISGGVSNYVNANYANINGGSQNQIYSDFSGIASGYGHYIGGGTCSFIGGGNGIEVDGNYAVISGGYTNFSNSDYSFIGGGLNNEVVDTYCSIVGGQSNEIVGGTCSFIGGGFQILIGGSPYSAIVGGNNNSLTDATGSFIGAGNSCTINADYSFIGSGQNNTTIVGYSFIGTGQNNTAENYATVVNGQMNNAYAPYSFIGNGTGHTVVISSLYGTVLNGTTNQVSGGSYGSVLNGENNYVSGDFSTIINGLNVSDKGRIGWTGYSTGTFGISGDQQAGFTILSGFTGTGSTSPLILTTGNAAGVYNPPSSNNIINLVPFSVLAVKGMIIGSDTNTQDSGAWEIAFVIKQGAAGASATAIVGTPIITSIAKDTAFASVGIAITADTTNGGVSISVSNSSGWSNITYWEASLSIAELVIPSN